MTGLSGFCLFTSTQSLLGSVVESCVLSKTGVGVGVGVAEGVVLAVDEVVFVEADGVVTGATRRTSTTIAAAAATIRTIPRISRFRRTRPDALRCRPASPEGPCLPVSLTAEL